MSLGSQHCPLFWAACRALPCMVSSVFHLSWLFTTLLKNSCQVFWRRALILCLVFFMIRHLGPCQKGHVISLLFITVDVQEIDGSILFVCLFFVLPVSIPLFHHRLLHRLSFFRGISFAHCQKPCGSKSEPGFLLCSVGLCLSLGQHHTAESTVDSEVVLTLCTVLFPFHNCYSHSGLIETLRTSRC